MKGKKTHPLAARIKRMMQQDEEVGKIAQAAPVLIGAAPALPPAAHPYRPATVRLAQAALCTITDCGQLWLRGGRPSPRSC